MFALSVLASILGTRSRRWDAVAGWAFGFGTVAICAAFGIVVSLFVNDRFEFNYVFAHGDSRNSIPLKVAGAWAGQEGSFMLWAVTSAVFAWMARRGTGELRRWYTATCGLFLAALSGIMANESAFRYDTIHGQVLVPPDGNGLAPALQNYWIVIHPPIIFLGFGSLLVLFGYAVAALGTKRVLDWPAKARPWSILSLTLVGLGLCLGGFWAYETLGWGGFWMWDPVENTSFVPWVVLAALVHGIMTQIARGRWVLTNVLLAGLPFLAFMYGTFLTRSGLLADTSVHSFAQMDNNALKLLVGLFFAYTIGFLGFWAWRGSKLRREFSVPNPETPGIHREGMYRFGTFLLTFFALATAVGMSVPMFMSLFGRDPKVVEEWLYHQVLAWPFIPIMLVMGAAPFVSWRGIGFKALLKRLYGIVCVTVGLAGLTLIAVTSPSIAGQEIGKNTVNLMGVTVGAIPWVLFLAGLCWFVVVSHTWRAVELWKRSKTSAPAFMVHVGVAVALAGLIVSRGFERKDQVVLQQGIPAVALGWVVDFERQEGDLMDRDNKITFRVQGDGYEYLARPGFYYMRGQDGELNPMVWPDISVRPLYDIYLVLHAMELNASELTVFEPGETKDLAGFKVTYRNMTQEGEAGMLGTKFGADVLLEGPDGEKFEVNPQIELAQGGLRQLPALVGENYFLTMQGMDAATRGVNLQLHFLRPVWFVEVFYKPLTILVWIGVGIMSLAGFWAAWVRRFRPRPSGGLPVGSPETPEVSETNAPTPVA
ncbi:MAG: cytochrome c biogenesis protein CcsA [Fimbriimonadaceae bacterium]